MAEKWWNGKHARDAHSLVVRNIRIVISHPGSDLSNNPVPNAAACLSLQTSVKPSVQIARKPSSWKRSFLKLLNRSKHAFRTPSISRSWFRQFFDPTADRRTAGAWRCHTRFLGKDQRLV